MAHSSNARPKPKKPRPTFPLYPHPSGQWAKKVAGRFYYFGTWDDPAAAEARYLRELPFIQNGAAPPPVVEGLTVRDLANHYLTAQEQRLSIGEITQQHFYDLQKTSKRVVDCFGRERPVSTLTTADFAKLRDKLFAKFAPSCLVAEFARVRSLFNWGSKEGLLDRPVPFGAGFKGPSKRTQRLHKQSRPKRFFEREELLVLLLAAGQPLEAMLLLGLNGGLGNEDVCTLPVSALDLKNGWLDFHRGKTGIPRRIPLWPETIDALKEVIGDRTQGFVFRTKQWNQWQPGTLSQRVTKLLKELGTDRPGVSFYSLRHVCETIGGESRDQVAVDAILGHADGSMASVYRERVSDERLLNVTNTIRNWLLGSKGVGRG